MVTAYPVFRGFSALKNKIPFKDRLPKLPLFVWLILIFISALLFSAGIYIALDPNVSLKSIFQKLFGGKEVQNVWEPAPTTTPPLFGTGRQLYTVGGGTTGLPHITQIGVDPIDPKKGEKQTIFVTAINDTPIKEIIITLHTDEKDTTMPPLTLDEGSNTEGVWKGEWKFDFTYNLTYRITAVARNESNLGNPITITLR
jgi:hypothetical protein